MVTLQENDSQSSGATSASLLDRLKSSDPRAWERFVDLYGPLVFHWCRRHGLQDDDAADVMQEVLSSVARAIPKFQYAAHRGRFRGWLWSISRNKIRDHYRRLSQHVRDEGQSSWSDSLDSLPEEWSDDQSEVTRSEVRSLIHRAIELIRSEFHPQTWEAFWRSTVDGETTQQIAEDLGLSSNSVRQAKSRVLRRLRSELGDIDY